MIELLKLSEPKINYLTLFAPIHHTALRKEQGNSELSYSRTQTHLSLVHSNFEIHGECVHSSPTALTRNVPWFVPYFLLEMFLSLEMLFSEILSITWTFRSAGTLLFFTRNGCASTYRITTSHVLEFLWLFGFEIFWNASVSIQAGSTFSDYT